MINAGLLTKVAAAACAYVDAVHARDSTITAWGSEIFDIEEYNDQREEDDDNYDRAWHELQDAVAEYHDFIAKANEATHGDV